MPVRVLVACEFSGIVREAFRAAGHDAWSADLLETEIPGPHYRGDVREVTGYGWDLMVAFPPCQFLCNAGNRWHAGTRDRRRALAFVRELLAVPVPRLALENPYGAISSHIRKPDQVIQPWQFGHGETKATCLWLAGLPPLVPSSVVPGRAARVHRAPDSRDRWKARSRTLPGIAAAMASQWGGNSPGRISRVSPGYALPGSGYNVLTWHYPAISGVG
jgi:site-specific DNA-cytosine methylase